MMCRAPYGARRRDLKQCAVQHGGCWPPRHIVAVRALHLGDLLHAVPALRALRRGFPQAEITLVGLPWAASFVERFSDYVDRFVEFPGYPGIVEAEYDARRTSQFFEAQAAYGYDLAIQMHGSGRNSNGFTLGLGPAVTAGYHDGHAGHRLQIGLPYPDHLPEAHRHLQLVSRLGCDGSDPRLEFPLFAEDFDEAANLLDGADQRPLVGIHAGARAPSRRWPPERFAALADAIVGLLGATIVLTGSPEEIEQIDRVEDRMTTEPLNVSGRTSLGGLAALIERFDLFISNDTGPAHIAQALGTPSVIVFGPADPVRWAPQDQSRHRIVHQPVPCSPCEHWQCPIDHRCLRRIEPSRVLAEVTELVEGWRAGCAASRS